MSLPRRSSATPASLRGYTPATPSGKVLKRSLDMTASLCALPFLAVSTFAAAAVMSVTSPGPIFFREERVGLMGRRFHLFRFRTLHVGSAVLGNRVAPRAGAQIDPVRDESVGERRFILGGWFMRASGLAGLPQFLNVLQGEMSLVGPRPCHSFDYERSSASERRRLHVRPGITGLVQTSAAPTLARDQAIRLELHYAAHRSFRLDAAILVRSIPITLRRLIKAVRPPSPVARNTVAPSVASTPPEPFELK
jgi:lipopolysaccharide/colanic/teichoic acid biosynthesis glycosyltransferase